MLRAATQHADRHSLNYIQIYIPKYPMDTLTNTRDTSKIALIK
jgi:hypothetical protein